MRIASVCEHTSSPRGLSSLTSCLTSSRPLALLLLFSSMASTTLAVQDPTEPAPAAPQEAAAEEVAAEFARQHAQWLTLQASLMKLQAEFAEADQERRLEIREEFGELYQQMTAMVEPLTKLAKAAYMAKPNADEQVVQVLVRGARTVMQEDEYAEAQQIIDLLVENNAKASGLYDLAGINAFCQNRFEQAEAYFARATEEKEISGEAMEMVSTLEDGLKAAWEKEVKIREQESQADDLPRVRLETSQGNIVLELFENEAPETVGNFISLVEQEFYDGLKFHRVLPGFMAQGGCPVGNGTGGPGYKIHCECYNENARKHFAGTLSMAHAGRDTGGSQFFLTHRPTPYLDTLAAPHTVFGRIIEGKDVLAKLALIDPRRPDGTEPDKIIKAVVIRKRDHEYVPNKVD